MSFNATVLVEAREAFDSAASKGMEAKELRMPSFGAFQAHLDSSPLLMPGFAPNDLKKSTQQPLNIAVFKKQPLGTGTVRKCAGSGTGATALKPIVFQTIVEEFALLELEMINNNLSYQEAFNRLLMRAMVSAYTRLEVQAVAHFETLKSPVNNGAYFPTTTGNAKVLTYAQRLELWAGVGAEMMDNDFSGAMNFVGDSNTKAIAGYVGAQGAGSGVVLNYQQEDFNGYYSRFVQRPAGAFAAQYFFEPGTVGFYPWTRPDFLRGVDISTDVWSTFTDPIMGMRWELKVKKGCIPAGVLGLDGTTPVVGTEAGYGESFVISTDYSFTEAYSSDSSTGVFKYVEQINA